MEAQVKDPDWTMGQLGGKAPTTAGSVRDRFSGDPFHTMAVTLFLVSDCRSYNLKGKGGSNWPDGKDSFGNLHGRECFYQRTQSVTMLPMSCSQFPQNRKDFESEAPSWPREQ